MRFDLNFRKRLPYLFLGACAIFIPVVWLTTSAQHLSITISVATAILGFFGFLYSHHNQQLTLHRDLFREFNGRYAAMNESLRAIRETSEMMELTVAEQDDLIDYFNLCAEEFMYHEAGCIDERVWRAWRNGMRAFAENPRIRAYLAAGVS